MTWFHVSTENSEPVYDILNEPCRDCWLDSQEKIAAEVVAWQSKRSAPKARIDRTFTLVVARQKLRKLYLSHEDG